MSEALSVPIDELVRRETLDILELLLSHGTRHAKLAAEWVEFFDVDMHVVHQMIAMAPAELKAKKGHLIKGMVAGAPPPAAVLAAMADSGFQITHVYGLTETYGHVTECLWQGDAWSDLDQDKQSAIKARQGVAFPMMEQIDVVAEDGAPVARDGASQGEIVIRGNSVMKGYLKNPEATAESFEGGHFHSGDIAVIHPDAYVQIADRAKDIIISGGENISSVEVEGTLMAHDAVLLCAVVAKPDDTWGEVPCAFVELKDSHDVSEADLIAFARTKLAGFKTPKKVVFEELPKTSTGKIQKFQLRERAKSI